MKIRQGFVSNSSSSSFVIVGEKIKLSDVNPKNFTKGSERYMFESTLEGDEATTYGYINSIEMLEFLKKHDDLYRNVYEVYEFGYDADAIDISSIQVPKGRKAKIYSGTMGQFIISELSEIKDYFPEYFEDEEEEESDTPVPSKIMLECTENGHNKFYEMTDLKNGRFLVRYGKIGSDGQVTEYEIQLWGEKYREKINKGYQEV